MLVSLVFIPHYFMIFMMMFFAGVQILCLSMIGEYASKCYMESKHRPIYTPHVDTGEFVIVINADKLVLTGKKLEKKMYYRHTGYVGGIKEVSAQKLMATKPEDLFKIAVKGMLPKNSLGRHMLSKLKIYSGSEHPHAAQNPVAYKL